jgi:hypothetical protein
MARRLTVLLVSVIALAACATGGRSPSPIASSGAAPSSTLAFEVKQQGSDGSEVTIIVIDDTGSLVSARAATEQDEQPVIDSEIEPRIGPVPGAPNDLRVLWGGAVCDTSYAAEITTNPDGALHVDVGQGPMASSVCDSLGIRRGVVLTFSAPVDATKVTGEIHRAHS